jgi:hypothetical protein
MAVRNRFLIDAHSRFAILVLLFGMLAAVDTSRLRSPPMAHPDSFPRPVLSIDLPWELDFQEGDGVEAAPSVAGHAGWTMDSGVSRRIRARFLLSEEGGAAVRAQEVQSVTIDSGTLPEEFDLRKQFGSQCPSLLRIRDQGECNSCYAIAALDAFTDRRCLHQKGLLKPHQDSLLEKDRNETELRKPHRVKLVGPHSHSRSVGNPNSHSTGLEDFSVLELLSCCGDCGKSCTGGRPYPTWNYLARVGAVGRTCFHSQLYRNLSFAASREDSAGPPELPGLPLTYEDQFPPCFRQGEGEKGMHREDARRSGSGAKRLPCRYYTFPLNVSEAQCPATTLVWHNNVEDCLREGRMVGNYSAPHHKLPAGVVEVPLGDLKRYRVARAHNIVGERDIMTELWLYGPVEASMELYTDFFRFHVDSKAPGSAVGTKEKLVSPDSGPRRVRLPEPHRSRLTGTTTSRSSIYIPEGKNWSTFIGGHTVRLLGWGVDYSQEAVDALRDASARQTQRAGLRRTRAPGAPAAAPRRSKFSLNYSDGFYRRNMSNSMEAVGENAVGPLVGVKYWIAANSWNSDWGDEGFFKILRGVNECGIETAAVAGKPIL